MGGVAAIVRFDGEIDPTTVDADSLYLIANGARLPGTVRVSSTNRFATFLPDEALPASTEVRIGVDGDRVRDAAGSFLDGADPGDNFPPSSDIGQPGGHWTGPAWDESVSHVRLSRAARIY